MKQQIKKRIEGFTIIEVMIVLAIAGLILLIVFLAVPALQRNSRNTQRGNDAARALAAAQEVLNNNNGDMATVTSANIQAAIAKPAYYTLAAITTAAAPLAATNGTTIDSIIIYRGSQCATAPPADVGKAIAGTTRQMAAVWTAEAAQLRCQDS
ncbi:MAG: prepilin-type N-terminal cleavage/methylation domain-containing protein [Patescibacteria group bacterium]